MPTCSRTSQGSGHLRRPEAGFQRSADHRRTLLRRKLAIVGVKGEPKTPEEMDAILAERRANWKPKAPKYTKGLLKLYSQHAVSPMKGAYME